MARLIEATRRRHIKARDNQLQLFLRDRKVWETEVVSDLPCDGVIEPIGTGYGAGFRMRLKKNSAEVRLRFTIAHELCHTFFYELVPELKFTAHEVDEAEERLCNWGAASLLIPSRSVRRAATTLPVCLESLDVLAADYGVSLATIALRLRSLGIWKSELSLWRRMTNGNFVLDRLYGGKQCSWEWEDATILREAWGSDRPLFGTTFLNCEDARGNRRYRPVTYQLRRHAEGVLALWGVEPPTSRQRSRLPLFGAECVRQQVG